ncbi:hypothetical protein BD779DRAFT_1532805 [Infundibulicybe gibba]|nr:hypothetical protein BD779DRAFT_1532805 [Infundibulicybe gibba]
MREFRHRPVVGILDAPVSCTRLPVGAGARLAYEWTCHYTRTWAPFVCRRGRDLVVSDVLSYRMWACRLLVCKRMVPLYTGALSRGIQACRLVTIAFCGGCSVLSHAGAPSCRVWVCHPAACAVASRRAQVHGLGPGVKLGGTPATAPCANGTPSTREGVVAHACE